MIILLYIIYIYDYILYIMIILYDYIYIIMRIHRFSFLVSVYRSKIQNPVHYWRVLETSISDVP